MHSYGIGSCEKTALYYLIDSYFYHIVNILDKTHSQAFLNIKLSDYKILRASRCKYWAPKKWTFTLYFIMRDIIHFEKFYNK